MAKESVRGISVALPPRHIDAIDAAAGSLKSRSSMLAEIVEWAIQAGRLRPYSASGQSAPGAP